MTDSQDWEIPKRFGVGRDHLNVGGTLPYLKGGFTMSSVEGMEESIAAMQLMLHFWLWLPVLPRLLPDNLVALLQLHISEQV